MASTINTITTGAGGIVATADNTGNLSLQTIGTTALTIDTSQNVGIGTSSPATKLQVTGASGSLNARINAGNTGLDITSNDATGVTDVATSPLGAGGKVMTFTTYNGSSSAERMRIDSSGRVTTPYQPMFSGYRSATPTTVAATNAIIHNQVFVNVGSNYDTSNGRFTAPIAGYYEVIIFAHAENSTPINCGIYKNGSNIMSAYQGGAAYGRVGNTAILSLAAGDYIQHYVTYGTIWAGDISGASMSVKLIG